MMAYECRLERLRQAMAEQNMGLSIITSPTNIYFLTGFFSNPYERFMALVMDIRNNQTLLFVPALDTEAAGSTSYVQSIIPVSDTDDPYSLLVKHVGQGEVSAIGIEKKDISLFQFEKLSDLFPHASYVDLEPHFTISRLKKSKEEIEIVRKAVQVAERVLDQGVKRVVQGATELEITAELEYQMKVLGADRPAFSTTVLTGPHSALPHGHPGNRRIRTGDFLLIDLGVFVEGYCSDITRTFAVGEVSEEQKRMYETVLEANKKAIESVKAGEPIRNVDRAARLYIESKGYGPYFTHRVGHGLGLEVHEPPSIHSQNELMMEPCFLFTIEPGIYVPGLGGVRIEDDIYIGENGKAEVLTSYTKELTVL